MAGLLTPVQGGEVAALAATPDNPTPDVALALPDNGKDGTSTITPEINRMAALVTDRFTYAEQAKRPDEQRWQEVYRNYRGFYGPDQVFLATEKSRVFIKVTKTKVFAAYGQLIDTFFANNQFPISVESEKLPGGLSPNWHVETNPQVAQQEEPQEEVESPVGYPGDGKDLEAGFTIKGVITKVISKLRPNEQLKEGAAASKTAVDVNPYDIAAKEIEKQIQDQLKFSEADKHLRYAAFENVLFGSCIIKGPLATTKEIARWDDQGNYTPIQKKYPKLNAVSVWNFYPDPDATSMEDCQWVVERHALNRNKLHELKNRPFFISSAIDKVLSSNYNYVRKWWEPVTKDIPVHAQPERYEVLEYWGMIDKQTAMPYVSTALQEEIQKAFPTTDNLPVNIWVCNGEVLRFVINPFDTKQLPYFVVPHEIQPYRIFGIGVGENMTDTQQLMNGFMRMAVDNAALSGNLIFELDESLLVPGQDYTLYPGKFFRKQSGSNMKAIEAYQIPNVAQYNLQLFDKARELADEATFPSYMHGQTGVNPSLGRTSSGISMMMGASSIVIRNVVKNFDDYLFAPLGQALYGFNCQFNPSKNTSVNVVIKAGGTDALMRNEVKSQRITAILGTVTNPILAPWVKIPNLLREGFKALDFDPDTMTNTAEEAQRQMLWMAQQQQAMQAKQPQQQGQGTEDSGLNRVAHPGEEGFTAAHSQGPKPAQSARQQPQQPEGQMNGQA